MKSLLASIIGFLGITAFSMTSYDSLSAEKKSEVIWKAMNATVYETLPNLDDQTWTIKKFPSTHVNVEASKDFSTCKDHSKATIGTVIKVAFAINRDAQPPFSGIFSSGARFGFLRIALADPPSKNSYTPGLVLRLLRNGSSSTTIYAMPSLDSQYEENLFTYKFKTRISTPAFAVKNVLMAEHFNNALHMLDQKNGAIEAPSFDEAARVDEEGKTAMKIKAPSELIFKPTTDAQRLFAVTSDSYDFRAVLNNKAKGLTLFFVYAKADSNEKEVYLGNLIATSDFIASELGDYMFNAPNAKSSSPFDPR